MYQQTFGLKKRPFSVEPAASDVFVGPQTATTMAGLRKALLTPDGVAVVVGPAGSGKTTLVNKALSTIGEHQKIVVIGRIRLGIDDVLDLLLRELDIKIDSTGTLQKFTAFRHRLCEFEETDTRVTIVVEDAIRLGVETLAEIEALTAADAGPSGGASIVLLADERLDDELRLPQLARLSQRLRQRHTIEALSDAELRGYLRHCFRLAGADYEQIFSAEASALLNHLSKGIPRIVNSIVESAMIAAADQNRNEVNAELLSTVARDEFGLSSDGFMVATAVKEDAPTAVEAKADPEPESEPVIVFSDSPEESLADDEIPELINDTLPELAILKPELLAVKDPSPNVVELKPVTSVTSPPANNQNEATAASEANTPDSAAHEADISAPEASVLEASELDALEAEAPILEAPEFEPPDMEASEPEAPEVEAPAPEAPDLAASEPQAPETAAAESEPFELTLADSAIMTKLPAESDVPATSEPSEDVARLAPDPTLAELKPDLGLLEEAMALTLDNDSEPPVLVTESSEDATEDQSAAAVIPEITLDDAIGDPIGHEHNSPAPLDESAAASQEAPDVADAASVSTVADAAANSEFDNIAGELAKAKSIEDIDDKMAETLFGTEFTLAASQIMAKPPALEPANDNIEAARIDTKSPPPAAPIEAAPIEATPVVQSRPATPVRMPGNGVDLCATQQRLQIVRELNAVPKPAAPPPEPMPVEAPEPIEKQINTSITQTHKALSVEDVADAIETEEVEKPKSGFFSRFKRS